MNCGAGAANNNKNNNFMCTLMFLIFYNLNKFNINEVVSVRFITKL